MKDQANSISDNLQKLKQSGFKVSLPKTKQFETESILITPFKDQHDFTYLLELIQKYKYNTFTPEQCLRVLLKFGKYFWITYTKSNDGEPNKKYGVVYLSYFDNLGYTLDAYKDPDAEYNPKVSIDAGRIISNFVLDTPEFCSDKVLTFHDERNKAATFIVERIGFKEKETYTIPNINKKEDEEKISLILFEKRKGE